MEQFVIGLLVIASIVGLTFIVERGLALRWRKVIPPDVEAAVERSETMADLPRLVRICEENPSPLGRLIIAAADHLNWPRGENVDSIQTRARHEVVRLERGLVVLEIVVGTAPLLGLVGTVFGLITLFGGMGQTGVTENTAVAKGIAIALNATLMGLLAAIPSLVAWSYYNKKVERMAIELETICDEFLRRYYRKEKPTKQRPPAPAKTAA
jgi:biopolymer transport protein ExbB